MLYRFLISGLILTGCATGPKPSETEARQMQGRQNISRSTFPYDCVKQQEGYAGLVIVNLPGLYEIRSYFKGDADQKLSTCTDNPLLQVFETQLSRAIETPFSVADFEREQDIARAALRETDIDFFAITLPYGHADNWPERDGEVFDGHVLISVPKGDVSRTEAVLAPLGLQTVHVREVVYDEVILTSSAVFPL